MAEANQSEGKVKSAAEATKKSTKPSKLIEFFNGPKNPSEPTGDSDGFPSEVLAKATEEETPAQSYLASSTPEQQMADMDEAIADPAVSEAMAAIQQDPEAQEEIKADIDSGNTDENGQPKAEALKERHKQFPWDILLTVVSGLAAGLSGGAVPFIPFNKLGLDVTAERANRQLVDRAAAEGEAEGVKEVAQGAAYEGKDKELADLEKREKGKSLSTSAAQIKMNSDALANSLKSLDFTLTSQEKQLAMSNENQQALKKAELEAAKAMQEAGFKHNQGMVKEMALASYKAYSEAKQLNPPFKGSFAEFIRQGGGKALWETVVEHANSTVSAAGDVLHGGKDADLLEALRGGK